MKKYLLILMFLALSPLNYFLLVFLGGISPLVKPEYQYLQEINFLLIFLTLVTIVALVIYALSKLKKVNLNVWRYNDFLWVLVLWLVLWSNIWREDIFGLLLGYVLSKLS